jgi:hypothetical protein
VASQTTSGVDIAKSTRLRDVAKNDKLPRKMFSNPGAFSGHHALLTEWNNLAAADAFRDGGARGGPDRLGSRPARSTGLTADLSANPPRSLHPGSRHNPHK